MMQKTDNPWLICVVELAANQEARMKRNEIRRKKTDRVTAVRYAHLD